MAAQATMIADVFYGFLAITPEHKPEFKIHPFLNS